MSTGRPLILVIVASLTIGAGLLIIGPDRIIHNLGLLQNVIKDHVLLVTVILFVWSSILFLTVVPLGSATILVAGALLGGWCGWVQFAALVVSSMIIFESGYSKRSDKASAFLNKHARIQNTITLFQDRGILLTMALRVAPIIPSAMCSLICSGLSLERNKFLAGTLSVGWIRPVGLAYVGAALSMSDLITRLGYS